MTLEQARKLIEKYPYHDAFVEQKHKESIEKGEGDNSIRMSMLWAAAKDMIWQADSYDPIGCDHKKANGWTAWHLYSESQTTGTEEYPYSYLFVCEKCGDIKVSGRHRGVFFEQIVNIHWGDALEAMLKQANYLNEGKLFTEYMDVKQFGLFTREEVVELLADYKERILIIPSQHSVKEADEWLTNKLKKDKA